MYNYDNSFSPTDPHSTVCLWSNSRTRTRPYSTIAPHWSSSYPEYLSPSWDEETQQAVVWTRLREHRKLARKGLADVRERYKALRQEQQTRVESRHKSLSRDRLSVMPFNSVPGQLADRGMHTNNCAHLHASLMAFFFHDKKVTATFITRVY